MARSTSPPLIVLLLLMCNDPRVMGLHRNGFWLNALGGTTALIMGAAAIALLL